MTINNKILEVVYEPYSAVGFMNECPLTLGGLKNLFVNDEERKEMYEDYTSRLQIKDSVESLFDFVNETFGLTDSEIIEEILENEIDEYYIDFIQIEEGGEQDFWRIYKINREKEK